MHTSEGVQPLTVTVAIPTFGRDEVLVDTVRHVLALSPPADEVLVIDQTPGHGAATEQALKAWDAAGAIVWVRLPKPSIPHAMNEALLRARSDVVLYLDDDLVPAPALIARHREAIERNHAEAVVGQILQPGERPIPSQQPRSGDRTADLSFAFNSDAAVPVANVMAGNLAVRRDRALAIGGFDENFTTTAYRFETDFAWRLLDDGGRIWFEPSASIHHLKAERGGLRTWGSHLRSASPAHSTGDYYFAMLHLRRRKLPAYFARRIRQNAFSRFDLTHPWWIPVKLARECAAMLEAVRLMGRGRKLLKKTGSAALL